MAGTTSASSEKWDKQHAHRRERRSVKQGLHLDPIAEILPHRKDFGDGDRWSKDGKMNYAYFLLSGEYPNPTLFAKLMRK